MKKIVVSDFALADRVLRDPRSLANRRDKMFQRLEETYGSRAQPLAAFFGRWPMYLDGEAHAEARKKLARALRDPDVPELDLSHKFSSALASGGIDRSTIADITTEWHARLFGVDKQTDLQIQRLGAPILALVLAERLECFEEAAAGLAEIRDVLKWSSLNDRGLVAEARRCGASEDLVLNLILDSFSPMCSAAQIVCYEAAKCNNPPCLSDRFILDRLGAHPPFPHISRVQQEGGHCTWFQLDVAACNQQKEAYRSTPRGITFGLGAHTCPGLGLALTYSRQIVTAFSEATRGKCCVALGSYAQIAGKIEILDLKIFDEVNPY